MNESLVSSKKPENFYLLTERNFCILLTLVNLNNVIEKKWQEH